MITCKFRTRPAEVVWRLGQDLVLIALLVLIINARRWSLGHAEFGRQMDLRIGGQVRK